MLVLVIALSGCRTVVQDVELKLPTLEAFRPALMPDDLVAEPQTSKDILHNSVIWEFLFIRLAGLRVCALEDYVRDIKVTVTPPP